MPPIPQKDPADMTTPELEAEFRQLAQSMVPITKRRALLDVEMKVRAMSKGDENWLKTRFNKEERRSFLRQLKKEFGNE